MKDDTFYTVTVLDRELLAAAKKAREASYSPYSGFAVGAALLVERHGEGRRVIRGTNVENASYGLTVCAERSAILAAVGQGFQNFRAIAVIADTEGPCRPCGACRQVMEEFKIPRIIMGNLQGKVEIASLRDLLPLGFSSADV